MSKPPNIKSVEDAVARLNNPQDGDQIIVRAMPLVVPTPSYDLAITNASMQLLLDNFNKDPNAAAKYELSMCPAGRYEVVAIFHLRKVGDIEVPLFN